eukprot:GHVU01089879.1.p1 GENE.GHVU01089879.1~~GHVU01089879.1.p1  ORF type:complete len:135 (-),score=11.82 GHVU01089879.1:247-609(-)
MNNARLLAFVKREIERFLDVQLKDEYVHQKKNNILLGNSYNPRKSLEKNRLNVYMRNSGAQWQLMPGDVSLPIPGFLPKIFFVTGSEVSRQRRKGVLLQEPVTVPLPLDPGDAWNLVTAS